MIIWCLYVLDCLFIRILNTILVLKNFEPTIENQGAHRIDDDHTKEEEDFSSKDEVLTKEQRVKAAAERP